MTLHPTYSLETYKNVSDATAFTDNPHLCSHLDRGCSSDDMAAFT